jgi:hypothetical protein
MIKAVAPVAGGLGIGSGAAEVASENSNDSRQMKGTSRCGMMILSGGWSVKAVCIVRM